MFKVLLTFRLWELLVFFPLNMQTVPFKLIFQELFYIHSGLVLINERGLSKRNYQKKWLSCDCVLANLFSTFTGLSNNQGSYTCQTQIMPWLTQGSRDNSYMTYAVQQKSTPHQCMGRQTPCRVHCFNEEGSIPCHWCKIQKGNECMGTGLRAASAWRAIGQTYWK